jgi:hypothetical protein
MKKLYLSGVTLLSVLLLTTLASAGYSYYYPSSYQYNFPETSYTNQFQKLPTFVNSPTIKDISTVSNQENFGYSRNFQGPVIEENTKFDEYLKINARGKVIRITNSETTKRYLGAQESENYFSDSQYNNNREYTNTPTNPSYYDSGSIQNTQFQSKPKYYFPQRRTWCYSYYC